MSLGGAFHIFFMDISYIVMVGCHFTWACTSVAVYTKSPIQVVGCMTVFVVVPVICLCYGIF